MKLFTCRQIQDIDSYTIEYEPISSYLLMERAAKALFERITSMYNSSWPVIVFCGPGNNGGDGAAIGRMLLERGYKAEIFIISSSKYSKDLYANLEILKKNGVVVTYISTANDFPVLNEKILAIDSLFGSGLAKPLEGLAASLVEHINHSNCEVLAIDIPSGLFGEANPFPNPNSVIKAKRTLTIQFPKISFFYSENHCFVGDWEVVDISLHPKAIEQTETSFHIIDNDLARTIRKPRKKFDHKGVFGHSLIIAGSTGMFGAAILSAKACIKSGSGLVTLHTPKQGSMIAHCSIPEIMVNTDADKHFVTETHNLEKYTSIGIGPGIGTNPKTAKAFRQLLHETKVPIVIDADALNIISQQTDLLNIIPSNSIITPHPGEFSRLFGETTSGYERLVKAKEKAMMYGIVIVLKGAYTQVVCPDATVYFNSTGNPGMATAGSGDVLTGMITSLLGQGYSPKDAAILGVYIHGLAGDIAMQETGQESLVASNIIDSLGKAFHKIAEK